MPDYTRGVPRETATYIKTSATQELYYAYLGRDITADAGIGQADLAALGHIINTAPAEGALVFFGVNAPRPAIARKVINKNPGVGQKGSATAFMAVGKKAQAFALGWQQSKPAKTATLTSNQRTTTAVATFSNGLYYGWPMNTKDFNTISPALGLLSSIVINTIAEREKVIMGTKKHRPAQGRKFLDGGWKKSFISHDALETAAADGWSLVSGEVL